MTQLWVALAVAVAGGVGAAARVLVDRSISKRHRSRFPWGMLVVNVTGSLVLGVITGLALPHPAMLILATGLLGGYTTFSTASLDTFRLLQDRRYGAALLNGPGVMLCAVLAAVCGIMITRI